MLRNDVMQKGGSHCIRRQQGSVGKRQEQDYKFIGSKALRVLRRRERELAGHTEN